MELFKDISYDYHSEYSDVGVFKARLRLYRWTLALELQVDSNYSAATGGVKIPREYNDQLIYASSCIIARIKKIDHFGKISDDEKWIAEIVDPNIIFDLFLKLMEYDNSFKVKKEGTVHEGQTI